MSKLSSCGELELCIFISIGGSILCSRTCSLLASRSLGLRTRFPAISQSQFLIADASPKGQRTFFAILYLFSTINTRRCSTYPRTYTQPRPNHSQKHIWRPLALSEVTDFIFDANSTVTNLYSTIASAGTRSLMKGDVSDSNLWNLDTYIPGISHDPMNIATIGARSG